MPAAHQYTKQPRGAPALHMLRPLQPAHHAMHTHTNAHAHAHARTCKHARQPLQCLPHGCQRVVQHLLGRPRVQGASEEGGRLREPACARPRAKCRRNDGGEGGDSGRRAHNVSFYKGVAGRVQDAKHPVRWAPAAQPPPPIMPTRPPAHPTATPSPLRIPLVHVYLFRPPARARTVQHQAALARVPRAVHLPDPVREARVKHREPVEQRLHARHKVLVLKALQGEEACMEQGGRGGVLGWGGAGRGAGLGQRVLGRAGGKEGQAGSRLRQEGRRVGVGGRGRKGSRQGLRAALCIWGRGGVWVDEGVRRWRRVGVAARHTLRTLAGS